MIFSSIIKYLGEVFHDLDRQKGVVIEDGYLVSDYVYICLSILAKLAVLNVVGFIEGKSVAPITRTSKGKQRNFSR